MLREWYVIILTAIEAHSERSTRFTQTAFVGLGRNSLSGYCQVSSRSTAIALPYTWNICVFHWESPWKILCIVNTIVINLELTWQYPLSDFRCEPLWQSVWLHSTNCYLVRVSLIASLLWCFSKFLQHLVARESTNRAIQSNCRIFRSEWLTQLTLLQLEIAQLGKTQYWDLEARLTVLESGNETDVHSNTDLPSPAHC